MQKTFSFLANVLDFTGGAKQYPGKTKYKTRQQWKNRRKRTTFLPIK
jgi:hypothetical protein